MPPRHLSIQHVQEASDENDNRARTEVADRESCRSPKVDHQAQKGEQVRVDAGGRKRTNNAIQQPFSPSANRACERIHDYAKWEIILQAAAIAKWCARVSGVFLPHSREGAERVLDEGEANP